MLTADDILGQRLDESRPIAVSTANGGLTRGAPRGDSDCPHRARWITEYLRARRLRLRTTWPAAKGPHRRCEPCERFLFRIGDGR